MLAESPLSDTQRTVPPDPDRQRNPALGNQHPKTDPAFLLSARPMSLSVSPAFYRRYSSIFCSADFPGRPVRAIVPPPQSIMKSIMLP